MATIRLEREETEERMLWLAFLLWYTPTIQVEETEEVLTTKAEEEDLPVRKVLNDTHSLVITWHKEEPNIETPIEFVSKKAQEQVDNWLTDLLLKSEKAILKEKQIKEEEQLEQAVKSQVWSTKIV